MARSLVWMVCVFVAAGMAGCRRQPKTDDGKTYTADQKGGSQGGGSQSGGSQSGGSGGSSQSGSAGGSQAGSSSGGGGGGQGSGGESGSGSGGQGGAEQPLNSPANTTNGKSSKASDLGTSDATRGQVVAEPGAPPEHDPQKPPPAGQKPRG